MMKPVHLIHLETRYRVAAIIQMGVVLPNVCSGYK